MTQRPTPQPRVHDDTGGGSGVSERAGVAEGEGNGGGESDDTTYTVAYEINDVLHVMMPWVTSLLTHLAVIFLALFVVWSVMQEEVDEEVIIPIARLSSQPGGSMTDSETVELEQTQDKRQVQSQEVAVADALQSLNSTTLSNLQLTGLAGGGGKIAPFGATSGGGGLQAKFYGLGGNATRIVYLVDASGSMIATLPNVIKELKRSVRELSDKQQYTVFFFQDGAPVEVEPRGWKTASEQNKKATADFVTITTGNIIPKGKTDPMAAIRLALRFQPPPQLMFILSDNITGKGKYEVDRIQLLKFLDDMNPDRKIKINTIQFIYPDRLNTLKEIAERHGGIYKFITDSDVGASR
ncbi:MAG: vWA domain-containing protein [Planctomycetota bacterium]